MCLIKIFVNKIYWIQIFTISNWIIQEITVVIDISETDDSDCQKLRAQLKGALLSKHNKVYIKLVAEYNKTEMVALPILSWGGDVTHLHEMKQRGYLYEIDYVFSVIYIDSYVDLYSLFKKFKAL